MEKLRIRRTSSDYIGAINKTQYSDIDIKSTRKNLIYNNSIANLNLNEQFIKERENCRNYRIILTVNPYCTNVLFNPCTEITYVNKEHISGTNTDVLKSVTENNPVTCNSAIGLKSNLKPYNMVRNTEYSNEKHGFTYHPGLDIFNNHTIRNKSYRIVNRCAKTSKDTESFNTIEDYLRLDDGTVLNRCCRLDVNDTETKPKHLYNADDILSFSNGDAITENLKEENGWFGFYNTSTIGSKDANGESLNINRTINNKGNCQFIDMYPGRELFSFAPQYNELRNRVEYNWDLLLTYPFEHTVQRQTSDGVEDIHVVQSGGCNGLFIVDTKMIHTPSGGTGIQFRTLTKHNLVKGDIVHLYFNENSNGTNESQWVALGMDFIVYGTGDQDGNNEDYYFYINNLNLLDRIFCTPKEGENYSRWDYIRDYFYEPINNNDVPNINTDPEYTYKINELVQLNGIYYICSVDNVKSGDIADNNFFKYFTSLDKVALRYSSPTQEHDNGAGLTNFPTNRDHYIILEDDNGNKNYYTLYNHDIQRSFIQDSHVMSCDDFIMKCVNNALRIEDDDFQTIGTNGNWNDYISFRMVKVVDGIDCEYYVRKFKKLPGNYNSELYKLAFADTIYGDDLAQITFTDTINTDGLVDNRGMELSEIFLTIIKANRGNTEWYEDCDYNNPNIECSRCFGHVLSGFDYFTTMNDSLDIHNKRKGDYDIRYIINDTVASNVINFNDKYITSNDDWFYGDIVEYCPSQCTETVLCDINFRFNTMQRESGVIGPEGNGYQYTFKYDDIVSDDYDTEFNVETKGLTQVLVKNEGYYYKPHYRLRLRGRGVLKQDNHRSLFIASASPYQMNGMYIKISTRIKHRLTQGNKVIVTDNIHGYEWVLDVVYVINNYTFVINKVDRADEHYHDWVTICTCINNEYFTVKAVNENIPKFASKIGNGTYLWRESIGLWNDNEPVEYPYANNALYIDKNINFYLKRQNSDRSIIEYSNLINNDKLMQIIKDKDGLKSELPSNYEYKKENKNRC